MVGYSEVTFESIALFALRGHCGLGGDKGCRPFPRTLFLASGALPPLRSGQVFLDEADSIVGTAWGTTFEIGPFSVPAAAVFTFTVRESTARRLASVRIVLQHLF
jgi:hypothetical protein